MKITKELIKKLENATDDEAVQIFLQEMFDSNKYPDKKNLLKFMQSSTDKFFKANRR